MDVNMSGSVDICYDGLLNETSGACKVLNKVTDEDDISSAENTIFIGQIHQKIYLQEKQEMMI